MSLLKSLIGELVARHPTPWSYETDWTVEVYDANRQLVIKLLSVLDAIELVRLAEDVHEERRESARMVQDMMSALEGEP